MRCKRRVALLLLVLAAGCDDGRPPAVAAPAAKVYRHSEDGAPASLDPAQASTTHAVLLARNLYDTLYAYRWLQRPYALKPNLAAAMPEISADGLVYRIRLKPGVRFIDDAAFADGRGRTVTAQDVVYTIQRHFYPDSRAQGAWAWRDRIVGLDDWQRQGADFDRPVAGLRALDALTLEVRLLRPYPQFVDTLALGLSAVVPREAVERYGREFAVHPVGSGPFRLLSFDSTRAVLERNPAFRREPLSLAAEGYDEARHAPLDLAVLEGRTPPFVDRVQIDWIAEPSARWASFNKGDEIQYTVLPPEQFDAVLAARDPVVLRAGPAQRFRHHAALEAALIYSSFNLDDPVLGRSTDPGRDVRNHALRCAVVKAFDWQARNERFYGGVGRVFPGVLLPQLPEFDPAEPPPQRDLAGARALLAQHGWTPATLPVIEHALLAAPIYREMHEQLRGFLMELGWPAERIRARSYPSFGEFDRATRQKQAPLFQRASHLDLPDAAHAMQLFYGPNAAPGPNTTNYRNPAFDALYEQAATLAPGAERTQLYRRMNRMLIHDCVGLLSLARLRVHLWHRGVRLLPDRDSGNGFWLRYVDVDAAAAPRR